MLLLLSFFLNIFSIKIGRYFFMINSSGLQISPNESYVLLNQNIEIIRTLGLMLLAVVLIYIFYFDKR